MKPLVSALLGKDWPAEAIDQAINDGQTRRVPLNTEVPVYVLYITAYVDPGGLVEFRDDLYGRDRRFAATLSGLDGNCTACGFWDTRLNPTRRRAWFEAACVESRVA